MTFEQFIAMAATYESLIGIAITFLIIGFVLGCWYSNRRTPDDFRDKPFKFS